MYRGVLKERTIGEIMGDPILLQLVDDDWATYCVRVCGQGRYFQSYGDARDYIRDRWNIDIGPIAPDHEYEYAITAMKKFLGRYSDSADVKTFEVALEALEDKRRLVEWNKMEKARQALVQATWDFWGTEHIKQIEGENDGC